MCKLKLILKSFNRVVTHIISCRSLCPLPVNLRCADENLGQTGLSDTAEILDELVKEGYLSPTDLDFSQQTAQRSK